MSLMSYSVVICKSVRVVIVTQIQDSIFFWAGLFYSPIRFFLEIVVQYFRTS